jgi:hypothetical protein
LENDLLQDACIAANILLLDQSGLRFAYGYGYCYFVAKYFQEGLADLDVGPPRDALFARLKSLSELVYNQNNANIVIFYVFLTKDRSLINYVIANAMTIFSEFQEFDFGAHADFANRLLEPLGTVELALGNPSANQQAYDQHRDERGDEIEPRSDSAIGDVRYGREIAFEYKLVIALRYLMLMGQILRNFPGSLKSDTKLELAFESYALGLRILGAVFTLSQQQSEELAKDITKVLRSKMAFRGSDSECRIKADQIVADMLREVTFGLLKRLSHAVGLRELEVTYEEVAALRDNNISCQMVQLSIRLDHFQRFPKAEVESLVEELKKNTFAFQTLRDLVSNHLHLFPRDYAIQQWSGSVLKMKVNTPEIRGSGWKLKA